VHLSINTGINLIFCHKNCSTYFIEMIFHTKYFNFRLWHCRFQSAFTACSCVFKVITLVWANQRNFFENATTCSKRMRKTLNAMQLKFEINDTLVGLFHQLTKSNRLLFSVFLRHALQCTIRMLVILTPWHIFTTMSTTIILRSRLQLSHRFVMHWGKRIVLVFCSWTTLRSKRPIKNVH